MSDRKLAKKLQPLLKQVWKLSRRLTQASLNWLLRTVFLLNRRPRVAGFVLPTTVFLILVVSLTVGALTFRSFNSTTRTIGNVQSRQIYNAATPAIDRARAKLDYLFGKDTRLPGGIPAEEVVISMLLNDGLPVGTGSVSKAPEVPDPYTFLTPTDNTSEEKRIDLDGGGRLDNAWIYTDKNTNSSVIYSITLSTPDLVAGNLGPLELLKLTDEKKAEGDPAGPFVRNGPLSNSEAVSCRVAGSGSTVEDGWYQDTTNTSILRKRFQVDAFVVSNDTVNKGRPTNFTTLEFAQDRKLDRGNKWGAWFKYDLEVTPGSRLNWNGAMHSEGNIILGQNSTTTAYLISSPASCLFRPPSNSEISVREFTEQDDGLGPDLTKKFFGIIAAGNTRLDTTDGTTAVHTYNGLQPKIGGNLTTGNDWRVGGIKTKPSQFVTDPTALLTRDIQQAMETAFTNEGTRLSEAAIAANPFAQEERFFITKTPTQPYVDDTYRADNRYGPKVRYKEILGNILGTEIPATPATDDLIRNVATPGKEVGLDGYWERRTFKDSDLSGSKVYTGGMRILVGERLELGNPYGWVAPQDRPGGSPSVAADKQDLAATGPTAIKPGDGTFDNLRSKTYTTVPVTDTTLSQDNSDNPGDPLYPPYKYPDINRAHEAKQRRALRDNLGAVQAATVYHYGSGATEGRTPAACLALTSHPGSPYTLRQSVNFKPYSFNGETLLTDFFYGKGTNGWEFTPPDITAPAMQTALKNLANFAGDYDLATGKGGAFPPTQEAGKIHPDPTLTMWGNFSNLKRSLEAGNGSPADQSYQQTAGCMLGMLAYDINQVQKYNPAAAANQANQLTLGTELYKLMDGDTTNGEVLSKDQLATYNYGLPPSTLDLTKYNPRDYDRVTPDMFLAELLKSIRAAGTADPETAPIYQQGILVHEHYQIRRDRTYGFRPSPAANTWNYNPYLASFDITTTPSPGTNKPTLWSSACDPNSFALPGATSTGEAGAVALKTLPIGVTPNKGLKSDMARQRLALSRLCGTVIPPGAVHDYPGDNYYPSQAAGALENVDGTAAPDLVVNPATDVPGSTPAVKVIDAIQHVAGSTTIPPIGPRVLGVTDITPGDRNPSFVSPVLPAITDPLDIYKRAQVAPKFPSLYYIFPEFPHDQDGGITTVGTIKIDHRQPENGNVTDLDTASKKLTDLPAAFRPWKEPYLAVASLSNYQVVSATAAPAHTNDPGYAAHVDYSDAASNAPTGITSFNYKPFRVFVGEDQAIDLGVTPKATITDWTLPTDATTNNPNRVIAPDGTVAVVPFQDKVVFNGREWLPSRVLDIDLDMLRTSDKGVGTDTWLPASGIVYAFREDAVREDGIARPDGGLKYTNAQTPNLGGIITETDPLKDPKYQVAVKPIDFIADPDRRPHGFRLRNGAILKRKSTVKDEDNFRGLSFITDQPAYIMGNFNLHQATPGGDRLEEFLERLPNGLYNTTEFYDNRKTRDPNFASPTTDLWRPSEVLADTVIMLSDNFCDGSAIDTFMTAGSTTGGSRLGIGNTTSSGNPAANVAKVYTNGAQQGGKVYDDQAKALFAPGCQNDAGTGATSFLNQNRPEQRLTNNWNWARENPGDSIYSPVKISRNGNGLIVNNATGIPSQTDVPIEYSSANDQGVKGTYFTINDTNNRARALQDRGTDATTMNATLISNIIPSRANQQNGNLNNFPRFLEDWRDAGATLRFAGSFLQLGFSNYATAPYDQDRWEPTGASIAPTGDEYTSFFRPPLRLWGYDVALQLAQASPAATRFTTPSAEKNEFYTEPAANDPYMQNLCKALKLNAPTGLTAANLNCPA